MLISSDHVALCAVWVKNGGNRVSSIFILAPQQGLREKRSVADAIAQCFIRLAKKASPQWILEADIKACFDEIDQRLAYPPYSYG
jgi:hypothetical protein